MLQRRYIILLCIILLLPPVQRPCTFTCTLLSQSPYSPSIYLHLYCICIETSTCKLALVLGMYNLRAQGLTLKLVRDVWRSISGCRRPGLAWEKLPLLSQGKVSLLISFLRSSHKPRNSPTSRASRCHSFSSTCIMKLQSFTVLLAITAANATKINPLHIKRQATASSVSTATSATVATSSVPSSSGTSAISSSTTGISTGTTTAVGAPASATWGTSYPPLSQISSGMPSEVTQAVTTTYTAGASPTYYSGADPLPTPCQPCLSPFL